MNAPGGRADTAERSANMLCNEQLEGCHVALITPMMRRGSLMVIDYEKLWGLIDRCLDAGVAGLLFAGTTGQSATLSHSEQIELCARGIEYARARARSLGRTITCLASAGSNATAEALHLTQHIAEASHPDGLLHVTGYYNNPPQEGLLRHFETVADLAERLGSSIILYNIPGRTGSRIEPDTVIRLARHPGIAAVKDATGDLAALERIRAETDPESFALLSGEDHLVSAVIRRGGIGVISASANRWPAAFQRLAELANAGDFAAADELQAALQPCVDAVFSVKNPIPLHHMFDAGLRLPLVTVDELADEHRARVLALIETAEAIDPFPHVG
jgi:4-hydroxy-tetrahydrodipicolinate synthase